jgi:hypothetical protein
VSVRFAHRRRALPRLALHGRARRCPAFLIPHRQDRRTHTPVFPVDELSALPRASLSAGELPPSAPPARVSLSAGELPRTSLSADELDDLPRIPLSVDELDGLPREIEP